MSNAVTTQPQSLVAKFAAKYSIEPTRLLDTLKSTAFRQGNNGEVSNEQMAALLIVADQYGLNPFTKEIYAFPDKGGIVPVVGVDGWARIINEHPQCDGFEFKYSDDTRTFENKNVPIWMEVHIFRKDRARPVIVREYFDEVVRGSMQPWKSHPNRMLRHKTFIQGARLAFGFAGIVDEDEGERIMERDMGPAHVEPVKQPQSRSNRTNAPAIERPDQDGVIDEPVQRQRETVQQNEKPPQQRARAKPAQEQFEDAPATPVSDSVMRILKTKMEQGGVNESDIVKRFGFDLDGVTTANYNSVVAYVESPV
jgi:phage recombination protein Bet